MNTTTFLNNIQLIQIISVITITFIVVYGFSFGLKNYFFKFINLFVWDNLNQSTNGKILDALWIFAIGCSFYFDLFNIFLELNK